MTNPPYMGVANMSSNLSEFVKQKYPDSKTDLFAVFMEVCNNRIKKNGCQAMIAMQSWMFLSSYEKLREKLLHSNNMISLLHLGIKAFEEIGNDIVQTASFIVRKNVISNYTGNYFRLLTHDRAEKERQYLEKEKMFLFC